MQELIDKLNEMVAAGTPKSQLEESIGLPKNSLSIVLLGKKAMPESWIPKIQEFLKAPIEPTPTPVSTPPRMVVKKTGELSLAPSPEALKRMQEAIDGINKDFGEGSIICLGDRPKRDGNSIPTGSLNLDLALGIGGLPRGRIVEIYGPESSGKTTIATHVIAEAQKQGGKCGIIDAEQAFDSDYAEKIGVKIDELHISQPDYGEQALEEADRMILSGAYAVIVIDSVAALVPKGELEGEMGDSKMGLQARLMSQACRKLVASINKSNTLVIFINQLRATIGNPYGPQEVTTGGNALKFYASVRLDVRRNAAIKDGEETIGNKVKVRVVKSKVSPPFKVAEFDIMYGEGIDRTGEIIDLAVAQSIIQKNGSWYSHKESKLGQGRESIRQLLKDNRELCSEIEAQLTFTD